jgi:hypothetical protein
MICDDSWKTVWFWVMLCEQMNSWIRADELHILSLHQPD